MAVCTVCSTGSKLLLNGSCITYHSFILCLVAHRNEELSPPVRQTASIFKQPVTVIRSHPDSQVRHDLKHGNPDATQPRQLFWEKSLSDVRGTSLAEEDLNSIVLPSKVKGEQACALSDQT